MHTQKRGDQALEGSGPTAGHVALEESAALPDPRSRAEAGGRGRPQTP